MKPKKDLFIHNVAYICRDIEVLLEKLVDPYLNKDDKMYFTLQRIAKVENNIKLILNKIKEMRKKYDNNRFTRLVTSFENLTLQFLNYISLLNEETFVIKNKDRDFRRTFFNNFMEILRDNLNSWLKYVYRKIIIPPLNPLVGAIDEEDDDEDSFEDNFENALNEILSLSNWQQFWFSSVTSDYLELPESLFKYPSTKSTPISESTVTIMEIVMKPIYQDYLHKRKNDLYLYNKKNNLISLLFANRKLYRISQLSTKQKHLYAQYFDTLLGSNHFLFSDKENLASLFAVDSRGGMDLIAFHKYGRKFHHNLSPKEFFYIKKTIVKFQFDHDITIYNEFIEKNSKLDRYLDYLLLSIETNAEYRFKVYKKIKNLQNKKILTNWLLTEEKALNKKTFKKLQKKIETYENNFK